MSMYGWDLQVVPGPPRADLQRRVLEEWLTNPFLDDDAMALALRLGDSVATIEDALTSLCDTGFLRATNSGFMLALDLGGSLPTFAELSPSAATEPGVEPDSGQDSTSGSSTSTEAPLATEDGASVQLASLSGAIAIDPTTEADVDEGEDLLDLLATDGRADALTREIEQTLAELLPTEGIAGSDLIEALPFGLLVLSPTGAREMANMRAADMFDVVPGQLDGATFEMITGVNPLAALDSVTPLCFSLTEPRSIEVTLRGHRLPSGEVILILLRDVSLLEEVSQIQAEVQEELFQRLKAEVVDPLAMVERFLEKPDAASLVQARIAMEQINWFLQEFFLRGGEES
ncbi:MAG: hypothetical protein HOH74_19030 [Gemmatimonadetes bacterium]|jgi:hypothetical protein|nr:hypothetical protein [Gemmatimonadota bacterium]